MFNVAIIESRFSVHWHFQTSTINLIRRPLERLGVNIIYAKRKFSIFNIRSGEYLSSSANAFLYFFLSFFLCQTPIYLFILFYFFFETENLPLTKSMSIALDTFQMTGTWYGKLMGQAHVALWQCKNSTIGIPKQLLFVLFYQPECSTVLLRHWLAALNDYNTQN